MNTIKVIAIPEPGPDTLRSVTEWVNLAYATLIEDAVGRIGQRVRVASIEANERLRPHFLKDGTIIEAVFYVFEHEQLRFHVRLDDGNTIHISSAEFVHLMDEVPRVPIHIKNWMPPWMGSKVLGPEEKFIGQRVRITDANRFPGKYLEDGTIRQVFASGSGCSFVVHLSRTGELLKDVLESEVRFL